MYDLFCKIRSNLLFSVSNFLKMYTTRSGVLRGKEAGRQETRNREGKGWSLRDEGIGRYGEMEKG